MCTEMEAGSYTVFTEFYLTTILSAPIPVAALSNAWVCSRSLAGIVGSNPAGGIDACLL
jgi:hypothetical protein